MENNQVFLNKLYKLQHNGLVSSSADPGYPPGIWFFILVVQGFETLVFLELAEFGGVRELEERRRKLHQPLRVDCGNLPHVLLCSLHQLVVDNPKHQCIC